MNPIKRKKAEQVNMTYSAFLIRDIHVFSDNFSRLLPRTLCHNPCTKRQKNRRFSRFLHKKRPSRHPFLQGVQLSLTWLTALGYFRTFQFFERNCFFFFLSVIDDFQMIVIKEYAVHERVDEFPASLQLPDVYLSEIA